MSDSLFEYSHNIYDAIDILGDLIMLIPEEDRMKYLFGIILKLVALIGYDVSLIGKILRVIRNAQTRGSRR